MKKIYFSLLLVTCACSVFAEPMSAPRVTYDKTIGLDKAFACYINFAPKEDDYKNPFYSKDKTAFILPEFKNVKNKTAFVIKKGNTNFDAYRLDFSQFDPANYEYKENTYSSLIIAGSRANISVTLGSSSYDVIFMLLHHPEGDVDDASSITGAKEQAKVKKEIEERDLACSNYTCGNWNKDLYFGKISNLKIAETITGVKLSKQSELNYVVDLMMSSVIGELNGRFYHPDNYIGQKNYVDFKSDMKSKCPNVFVGL